MFVFLVPKRFEFRLFIVLDETEFIEMGIKIRQLRELTARPCTAPFHDLQHTLLVSQRCALKEDRVKPRRADFFRNQHVTRGCLNVHGSNKIQGRHVDLLMPTSCKSHSNGGGGQDGQGNEAKA